MTFLFLESLSEGCSCLFRRCMYPHTNTNTKVEKCLHTVRKDFAATLLSTVLLFVVLLFYNSELDRCILDQASHDLPIWLALLFPRFPFFLHLEKSSFSKCPKWLEWEYCCRSSQEVLFGCIMLSSVGWLISYFMGSVDMNNGSKYEKSTGISRL